MASTTRRFVGKLSANEAIDQVFLASDKQLRPNRSGNLYLQISLSDRTGSIDARLWNATDRDYQSFDNGDYVHVEGKTQLFQGGIQLIANRIRRADKSEVSEDDFVTFTRPEIETMAARVAQILRGLTDPHLRNLAECYLIDDAFMRKFVTAPAGIKHHHAYQGGLLEHVLSVIRLTELAAAHYEDLNRDLLVFGAFLHDLGKIDELTYERDLGYSDDGQLLGHIVLGLSLLDEKVKQAERLSGEPLPAELVSQLKHMLISHHGYLEYGSPKLPMTLEAEVLHHLDVLDARVHNYQQLIRDDANRDSPWTQYQHHLQRKLFKPLR